MRLVAEACAVVALGLTLGACSAGHASATETTGETSAAPGGDDGGGVKPSGALVDPAPSPPPARPPLPGRGGDTYPALHSLAPQVTTLGGRVLTAPRVVAVTFDGDPLRDSLDSFVAGVGGSAYWPATTAEYGVGPLTARPPIHDADATAAHVDDLAIQHMLERSLDGTHADWGTPDPSTMYVLFFPENVTITLDGYVSCEEFLAYHSEIDVGGVSIPYAVIPRCADAAGLEGIDVLTAAASHELVEAATDPLPYSDQAFADTDDAHAIWSSFTGGEVADMCSFDDEAFFVPPDLPFKVQRSWSNAAAVAGRSPCVPEPAETAYFNASPRLVDDVGVNGRDSKGVTIGVGSKKTIEVDLFSDAPTAEWRVSAVDLSDLMGGTQELTFTWDRDRGRNGDRLNVTIEVYGTDPYYAAGEGFAIISERDGVRHFWFGFVGN